MLLVVLDLCSHRFLIPSHSRYIHNYCSSSRLQMSVSSIFIVSEVEAATY